MSTEVLQQTFAKSQPGNSPPMLNGQASQSVSELMQSKNLSQTQAGHPLQTDWNFWYMQREHHSHKATHADYQSKKDQHNSYRESLKSLG